jgi:hypothetical protein
MAINSKKKGNRGELELVHILEEKFGEGRFKRTPSSGAWTGGKNREGCENLPWEAKITLVSDLITPADFNFVIEHKFYADISFWELLSEKSNWASWLNQVEQDADFITKSPLLVIKYNRHDRIALISFADLVKYAMSKEKENSDLAKQLHTLAKIFVWRGYSVVPFAELLKLPQDFWFGGNNI